MSQKTLRSKTIEYIIIKKRLLNAGDTFFNDGDTFWDIMTGKCKKMTYFIQGYTGE